MHLSCSSKGLFISYCWGAHSSIGCQKYITLVPIDLLQNVHHPAMFECIMVKQQVCLLVRISLVIPQGRLPVGISLVIPRGCLPVGISLVIPRGCLQVAIRTQNSEIVYLILNLQIHEIHKLNN